MSFSVDDLKRISAWFASATTLAPPSAEDAELADRIAGALAEARSSSAPREMHVRLVQTCEACPEQYDAFERSGTLQIAYLRLRHGRFRVQCPNVGGETIYEAHTCGDGEFSESERQRQLLIACTRIANHYGCTLATWATDERGPCLGETAL